MTPHDIDTAILGQSNSESDNAVGDQALPIGEMTLHLSGPFKLKNSTGMLIHVESLTIDAESYTPDVYVTIDVEAMRNDAKDDAKNDTEESIEDVIAKQGLYYDQIFIDGVMARLREIGYEGKTLGRAELGMQEDLVVVLEPDSDFADFVSQRGWTYAGGSDEYSCQKIMRGIDWQSKIEFKAADGTRFFIRMTHAIEAHANWFHEKNGGDLSRVLSDVSIPFFQSNYEDALLWIREEVDWAKISRLVNIVKRPEPDARAALQGDENVQFSWTKSDTVA